MKRYKYVLLCLAGDAVILLIAFACLRGYGVTQFWAAALSGFFVLAVDVIAMYATSEEYPYEKRM